MMSRLASIAAALLLILPAHGVAGLFLTAKYQGIVTDVSGDGFGYRVGDRFVGQLQVYRDRVSILPRFSANCPADDLPSTGGSEVLCTYAGSDDAVTGSVFGTAGPTDREGPELFPFDFYTVGKYAGGTHFVITNFSQSQRRGDTSIIKSEQISIGLERLVAAIPVEAFGQNFTLRVSDLVGGEFARFDAEETQFDWGGPKGTKSTGISGNITDLRVVSVPEPATIGTMGLGLCAIVLAVWRRRRSYLQQVGS